MSHAAMQRAFNSAVLDGDADERLEELQAEGILREVFPELQAMVGFGGAGQGHKDLWSHTKQVICQCVPKLEVRWAALFHDVGKVDTFSRESGKVTFHGHEMLSARMFDKAARRSGFFERDERLRIRFLVRHLGNVEAYASDWTDSAVRRLNRDLGEHFDGTVALSRADITTRHDYKRRRHQVRMDELVERAQEIAADDAKVPPLPKGLGNELMKAFNLRPGPRIGEIMRELVAEAEQGVLESHREAEFYVAYLKTNSDRFGLG